MNFTMSWLFFFLTREIIVDIITNNNSIVIFFFFNVKIKSPLKTENKCVEKEERRKGGGEKVSR